ncbi:MAG: phosphatidate cytidylyltransferase, partial [Lentisphaeria bacterium]
MLKHRLISGSILLTCAMIAFFTQGIIGITMFAIIGSFMLFNGIKEFFTFSKGLQISGYPLFTAFFALLYLFASYLEVQPSFASSQNALTTLTIIAFIIASFIKVFNEENLATGLKNIFSSTFCLFYIAWPLSFILKLFMTSDQSTNGRMLVLFMILVTKSSDIGAYFSGSICAKRPGGNHKMFPRL